MKVVQWHNLAFNKLPEALPEETSSERKPMALALLHSEFPHVHKDNGAKYNLLLKTLVQIDQKNKFGPKEQIYKASHLSSNIS